MSRLGPTVLLGGMLTLAAWPASAQDAALVEKGQQLFTAQKCTICHAVAGKGNKNGALDGVADKYTAEELRSWIVNAKEMAAKYNATRKPPMLDFSKLPAADVDALVAYLQTLKKS